MPRQKKQPTVVVSDPKPESVVTPAKPVAQSPAVLKLQDQIVDLVSRRDSARNQLNEAHAVYLTAQSRFQVAQEQLKGIEQEVQYRIGLIAQLENRQQLSFNPTPLNVPPNMIEITSTPAMPIPQQIGGPQFPMSDPNDMVNHVHATRDLLNREI